MLRRQKGFTLIELMIVIVVMAILAAIAVPSYREYQAQSRHKGAVRQIASDLMAARMQAISENNWIALNIDNSHAYTIFRDIDKNGTKTSTNNVTLAVKDLYPTYYDIVTYFSGTVVTFYPNGTGSTTTLYFYSTSRANWMWITISAAGRVKVWQ